MHTVVTAYNLIGNKETVQKMRLNLNSVCQKFNLAYAGILRYQCSSYPDFTISK